MAAGIVGMHASSPTFAYVDDSSIPMKVNDLPTINISLEHSKGPENADPKPGETFTYTGNFKYTVAPGSPSRLIVRVAQNPDAPFISAPTADDFKIPSGTVVESRESNSTPDTWVFTIDNVTQNGTITFTKQATVKKDVTPGTIIDTTASLDVHPTGNTGLEELDKKIVSWEPGACSGVAYFKYRIPTDKLGSWLADIKFSNYANSKDAILDPLPANASDLADPNMTKRVGMKVSTPGTEDGALTNEFLETAVVRNDDSTLPLFGVDPLLANGTFLDSINWPYNPATWTGTRWVKPGTVFEIRRGFTLNNCTPVHASTTFDAYRDIIGVQIDQGRRLIPVQDFADDAFMIGGKTEIIKTPWCQDIYIDEGNSLSVSNKVEKFNTASQEISGVRAGLSPTPSGGTIAVSPKLPNKFIYIGKDNKVYFTDGLKGMGIAQAFPDFPGSTKVAVPAGVDPYGILWAYPYNASPILYSLDLTNPKATWETHPALPNPRVSGAPPMDLTFTDSGDMVLMSEAENGDRAKQIKGVYTYSRKDITKPNPTGGVTISPTTVSTIITPRLIGVNGFAIGGDGMMYFGGAGNNTIYKVPYAGGTAIAITSTRSSITDMGSCSYITPQPLEPKFEIQKAAIDPLTGTAAQAGTTTVNSAQITDDGKVSIDYLIKLANIGGKAGTPAAITDPITPPTGFSVEDVLLDGKSLGKVDNFQIPAEEMAAYSVKTFRLTVKYQADNLEAIKNISGECNTEKAGSPGGGFFNQVKMENDADGSDNNDACIPVKPRPVAHLKLVKQIVDQNGKVLNTQLPDDLGHFTLAASGYTVENNNPLGGVSGQAKPGEGTAVDQDVFAGRYALSETITETGALSGYYQSGAWKCDGGVMPNGTTVDVPANGSVTCTIQNTRVPRFHTVKFAGTPDKKLGNAHVGEPVVLKGGKGDLVYRMEVVNDSAFAGNTGVIRDKFEAPAGLLIDPNKSVKVTFDGQGSRVGGKDTYSVEELKAGAILADSITNLGPQEKATFTITIPVMADTSKVEGSEVTKFEQAQAKLAVCNSESATVNRQEVKLANPNDKAAINNVNMNLENTQYAENDNVWYRDNFACIPVVENKWTVAKFSQFDPAADGADEANNGGDGYVKTPGSTGTSVTLASAQDGSLSATVKYKVVATNAGKNASAQPAITDVITLPQGFEITSAKYGKDENALAPVSNVQGNTVTFEIPAGTEAVNGGESVNYYIEVTGKISAEAAAKLNWSATDSAAKGAGECENEGAGKPGTGFFNKVSTQDDPGTDGNNDACTPVKPQLGIALVEKTDANGTRLSGAKFALYKAANSTTKPYTMGELVKAELDELTADNENRFPQDALASNDGDNKYMGRFVTPTLNAGTVYFLVETKSPTKDYSLLPEPLVFKVDGSNNIVPLNLKTGEPTGQATDGTFAVAGPKVTVHDPRAGELPKAGGNGHMPLAVGGTLLLLISTLGMTQAIRRQRQNR
ncbi:SpaA isopeptide-forming pilin-related protein [Boudabousia tangfeifanii]|uniref:SpaA isopeptide-forming pilin-related protein n=1 Tax=Boudabousia tangfeifanii TaxID=1912795 RepID=UPI0012ECF302|nr:hypothetical protein [Boudabousia tangfeifanii]